MFGMSSFATPAPKKSPVPTGLTPFPPGQSGNPLGLSRKRKFREAIERVSEEVVRVKKGDTIVEMTKMDVLAASIFNHATNPQKDTIPYDVEAMKQVLERLDPIDRGDASAHAGIQIIVNSESQRQFWEHAATKTDGMITPADTLAALRTAPLGDNGQAQKPPNRKEPNGS